MQQIGRKFKALLPLVTREVSGLCVDHTPATGGTGGTFSEYLMGRAGRDFLFFGTGGTG